jgi:hypothetical protein
MMRDADVVTRLRCKNPTYELSCEAADVIESLREEIRTQRHEIAQLVSVRNAVLDWDKPPEYNTEIP